MSLSEDRMMRLMAYADGELEAAERDEVEGWLAADPDARRFAQDLGILGELVKEGHAASPHGKIIAAFDVADAVMDAVAREKPASNVVSLDTRRQKSVRIGGVVAAALAIAASVFLVTRHKDEVPLAAAPETPQVAVATADPAAGVEVEPVESQGESVQVFYLANESSPTTSVVVWVDEQGAK